MLEGRPTVDGCEADGGSCDAGGKSSPSVFLFCSRVSPDLEVCPATQFAPLAFIAAWISLTVVWAEASRAMMPMKKIEATRTPIHEYRVFFFIGYLLAAAVVVPA
jgi:hypothetical protein